MSTGLENGILTLASECDECFQQCLGKLETGGSSIKETLQKFRDEFNTWTEYLGIFARRRKSLDYRLRDQHGIFNLISGLLLILQQNLLQLEDCIELFATDIPPELREFDAVDDGEETTLLDLSEISLDAIEDSLRELHRVSVALRQSTIGTEKIRARRYVNKSDARTDHPGSIMDRLETISILALETLYPNAAESLLRQLCGCMMDRYARLLFRTARHHDLKEDTQRWTLNPIRSPESPQKCNIPIVIESLKNRKPVASIERPIKAIPGDESNGPTLSSIRQSKFEANYKDQQVAQSRLKTTIIFSNTQEPPVSRSGDGWALKCEWCFTNIHPDWVRNGKWTKEGRNHYRKDLEPFGCLFEECAEELPSFPSISEWKGHMLRHAANWTQQLHRPPVWKCDFHGILPISVVQKYEVHDPTSLIRFSTPSYLGHHIRAVHKPLLNSTDLDIDKIVAMSVVDEIYELDVCPICLMTPKKLDRVRQIRDSKFILERMENHIAEHLQNLMLLSLRLYDIYNIYRKPDLKQDLGSMSPQSSQRSLTDYSQESSDSDKLSSPNSEKAAAGSEFSESDNAAAGSHSSESSNADVLDIPESTIRDWSDYTMKSPELDTSNDKTIAALMEWQHGKAAIHVLSTKNIQLTVHDYTVGWLCTFGKDLTTKIATALYREEHQPPSFSAIDDCVYKFGAIGGINVIIAGSPRSTPPGEVVSQMRSTFPALSFVLLIGLGSAHPSPSNIADDICRGDLLVTRVVGTSDNIAQYTEFSQSRERRFHLMRSLNTSPPVVLSALLELQSISPIELSSYIEGIVQEAQQKIQGSETFFEYPGRAQDQIFHPDYKHVGEPGSDCSSCDPSQRIERQERSIDLPRVHYGFIVSKDQLEATGLAQDFRGLVIRGICNYSDSHKTNLWRGYAALTAAAYAKSITLQVDLMNRNTLQTYKYLDVLSLELKANICSLPLLGTPRTDIEDETILRHLPYDVIDAAREWVNCLGGSRITIEDRGRIHVFIKAHLLQWIEVLSLLKTSALKQIESLQSMTSEQDNPQIYEILLHSKRFLEIYETIILKFPLKVYPLAERFFLGPGTILKPGHFFLASFQDFTGLAVFLIIQPEIALEIVQYLSVLDIIHFLQAIVELRDGMESWNLRYLDTEQLIYLFFWIDSVQSNQRQKNCPLRLRIPDIREKIKKRLQSSLKDYTILRQQSFLGPLDLLYLDLLSICQQYETLPLASDRVDEFINTFRRRVREARDFCDVIWQFRSRRLFHSSSINRSGRNQNLLENNEYWPYILFQSIMSRVRTAQEHRNLHEPDELLTEWTSAILDFDLAFGQGSAETILESNKLIWATFLSYIQCVEECDERHLPNIYMEFVEEDETQAGAYARYMICQGLGQATLLLKDDPQEISGRKNSIDPGTLSLWSDFWDILVGDRIMARLEEIS